MRRLSAASDYNVGEFVISAVAPSAKDILALQRELAGQDETDDSIVYPLWLDLTVTCIRSIGKDKAPESREETEEWIEDHLSMIEILTLGHMLYTKRVGNAQAKK